jgi:hypothetical protein
MPKRRLRRTRSEPLPSRDSGTLGEGITDQMRDLSVGMVRSGTEAARVALESIQQVGRAASDMVVPATRRSVRVASEAGRTAMGRAAAPSRKAATRSAGKKATKRRPR